MAHETGEPKNFLILGIGLTSVAVLVAVMFGLQSYFLEIRNSEQQVKVLGKQSQELLDLRAKEQKRLTSFAYVDKASGRVRIPIDLAMERLVEVGRAGVPSIQAEASPAACGGPAGGATSAAPGGSATPAASGGAGAVGSAAPGPSAAPATSGAR